MGLSHPCTAMLLAFLVATITVNASSLPRPASQLGHSPQQPGRFRCHRQAVCDQLRQPKSQGAMQVPLNSECVKDYRSGDSFCGFSGAACSSDTQCDFGRCSGSLESPGICLGGLGDACEGSEGPDDAMCAGNLGCSGQAGDGRAVCGGIGAECLYSGQYSPEDTPNNAACVSGFCHPVSLACEDLDMAAGRSGSNTADYSDEDNASQELEALGPVVAKEQQLRDPSAASKPVPPARVPDGMTCPKGLSACPLRAERSSIGHVFGCVDTSSSVNQCGGCSPMSAGQSLANEDTWRGVDCLALRGVASVACIDSKCQIFSCAPNFELDRLSRSCRPTRYW
ncbi:BQ5605_C010g06127 [Microbotryum silenes-dioicae]|uniref:BQ5605_C010g06127 protein n=1 Tax=Microbotryum silenes-dioicae TaxID=796604 RepID=A0A2X0LV51_9BASI|nr:BQ5605_C010g06127 [Microbotryum silenes-dioicae]